jgi:hypothetical protein
VSHVYLGRTFVTSAVPAAAFYISLAPPPAVINHHNLSALSVKPLVFPSLSLLHIPSGGDSDVLYIQQE